MDLSLFFAGTAGSVPTARRGLPAILLRAGGERILFDCGEGTQQQLLRSAGLPELEDGEYAEQWSYVRLPGGRRLAARVFLALVALQATDEPWDLAAWASAHKADFLAQCREWMRDCPSCEGAPVAFERSTS